MTIEFGDWRIEPYKTNGQRCWQVFHGKRTGALRYYSTLDAALIFCLEYDARNKVEGTYDLVGAIKEYWGVAQTIKDAAERASARDRTGERA